MYIIEKNDKKPLCLQLYQELKNDIIKNYKIGEKIPSIRKIASTYNLSKNTVERAYSQLVVEGYIDSYPKSGYIVTDTKYSDFNTDFSKGKEEKELKEDTLFDFFPARLAKDSFPLKLWKRLFTKVIDDTLDFGMYQKGQGELGLRKQVAQYLIKSRGVKCNSNQIIICNGFADSMGLLAKLLKNSNETLATEFPGYHIARKVFDSHSYKIENIPLLKDGIDLDILKKSKSRLVYITPSHQYPTGVAMPISKRMKLLDWAKNTNSFIIEDDYDSELNYINRPIPSLQGLDNNNRVIYAGTFSKSLSPAIRVSYLVLPPSILEKFNNFYESRASRVCLTTQKILEKFIEDGHWDKHLRKIRTQNKKKHNLMKSLLKEKIGNTMKIESQGAGLSIIINPTKQFDWLKLEKLAQKEKIKLYYAKERSGDKWQGLMMGFGGFKEEEIEKAINIFSQIWNKCIIE